MVNPAAAVSEIDRESDPPAIPISVPPPKRTPIFSQALCCCPPGCLGRSEPTNPAEIEELDTKDFYPAIGKELPLEIFQRADKRDTVINLNLKGPDIDEEVKREVSLDAPIGLFKLRLHRFPPAGIPIPPPQHVTVSFGGMKIEARRHLLSHVPCTIDGSVLITVPRHRTLKASEALKLRTMLLSQSSGR